MLTSKSEISKACMQEALENKYDKKEYNWWGQVEDLVKQSGLQPEFVKLTPEYLEERGGELIAKYC